MTAKAQLELHLTVAAGREVECAKHLASQIRGAHWTILATLAAELVQEHESRTAGSKVLVVEADRAERVLADLGRK